MSRPNPRSLRLRLQALVILSLLPSAVLLFLSARERRELDGRRVQQEAMRLVLVAASNLRRDVQAAEAFLAAMSQDLVWPRSRPDRCDEEMGRLQRRSKLFSLVGIADSAGTILCFNGRRPENSKVAETPWFREALQTKAFSVGYDGDRILSDKVTMDFALPYRLPGQGGDGGTLVLFCALDLDWLNDLASRVQLPENSTLTVLGSRDQVLARYPDPEKWVGIRIQDDPLAASLSSQKQGVDEAPGLDGIMRLYAFTEIPEGGLSLRLGMPSATAFADADRAMRTNLGWLGAGAVLALLAAWAAGHWMVVRPVNKLVAATRRLGQGNLASRTEMDYGEGELGQLARAVDEMAEKLEWRDAQLRESEQERLQTEGRFTEMVEMASDAIIGVDARFNIFLFNRGAQHIFGYEAEEVEGRGLRMLEPDDAEGRNGHSGLVAALRDPGSRRMDVKVRAKDGTLFTAEASFTRASRNGQTSYTLILRERKAADVPPEVPA